MTGKATGTPRRVLLDRVPEMVTISDRRGTIVYANPATERVSGYTPKEFAALDPFSRMHPEDRPRCEEAFAELMRTPGLILELEHRVRHKDGSWRWVEGTFASLFEDPEVGGLLATVRDVSGRKRTEEALRESEERYRAFVTASSDVVYRMGPDWSEMRQLDGRGFISDTAEPTEHWLERYIHPDDRPLVKDTIEEAVRAKGVFELEHRMVRVDGSLGWMLSRAVPVLGQGGEIVEWLGTASDVTRGREAEAVLRESEERQAFLLKLSDALRPITEPLEAQRAASRILREQLGADRVAYAELDPDESTARLLADDRAEGVAPLPRDTYSWSDFDPSGLEEARRGRNISRADVQAADDLTPAQKATFAAAGFRAFINVPLLKSGRLVAFIAVHFERPHESTPADIALVEETAERTWAAVERAHAEEALRASEEKYRTLFTSIDEGFCIIEVLFDGRGEAVDYRFLEANPAFERQTGLENAVGKTMRELAPEHEEFWFEIYGSIARTGEAVRFEHEAAALGRFYDVYTFRIGEPGENRLAIIFDDILERKRTEQERQRLRALEASARAEAAERECISRELHDRVAHTMGVAHQSLELYSVLAQSAPERAREKLEVARETTRTALDQTRDLSAQLAHRQTEETSDGLTSALRELLETHVPDGVETNFSAEGNETALPPHVREQAYLVMREAVRNAVAHSGCGRVGVIVEVDGGELRGRVEDDGGGFDPGGGQSGASNDGEDGESAMGVGLRSMRERTEILDGRLEISSKPGRGTAVDVRIPLAN